MLLKNITGRSSLGGDWKSFCIFVAGGFLILFATKAIYPQSHTPFGVDPGLKERMLRMDLSSGFLPRPEIPPCTNNKMYPCRPEEKSSRFSGSVILPLLLTFSFYSCFFFGFGVFCFWGGWEDASLIAIDGCIIFSRGHPCGWRAVATGDQTKLN